LLLLRCRAGNLSQPLLLPLRKYALDVTILMNEYYLSGKGEHSHAQGYV
jgi:hypothetical protein